VSNSAAWNVTLSRCPFCGHSAPQLLRNTYNEYAIKCGADDCEASVGDCGLDLSGDPQYSFNSLKLAAAAWNRRVPGS